MSKRIMISSVTASMITGMFLLTGCGGTADTSSTGKAEASTTSTTTPARTTTTVSDTAKTKAVTTPVITSEVTKVDTTKVDRTNCTTFTSTNSSKVRGLEVVALNDTGSVIGADTSSIDGEVCFEEQPARIEVRSTGYAGDQVLQCGNLYNYQGSVDCSTTWGNPSDFIRDARTFRYLFATLYETLGVPYHVYDGVMNKAITATRMIDLENALVNFEWHADGNINAPKTPFTAEAWKADIIRAATEIYTSQYSTENVQLVALAMIDGLIKMGAYGLADANTPLHDADKNTLESIVANMRQIEQFYDDYKGEIGGVNAKSLAAKLLTGDYLFGANGKIVYKEGLSLGQGLVATAGMPALNGMVANCIHSKDLVCGPSVNVYSVDGLIKKDYGHVKNRFGSYVPYTDIDAADGSKDGKITEEGKQAFYGPLNELSKLAVCDAIDNKVDYDYGVTSIQALCAPAFDRLDLNRNTVAKNVLPHILRTTQKYLTFTELALNKSTEEQYSLMKDYLANAVTIELSPKIDPSMYGTTQEFLTTVAIDMPESNYACVNNNDRDLEYLTLTFTAVYKIDANGAWTVTIKGKDGAGAMPEDMTEEELAAAQEEAAAAGICPDFLADPLGCVKCKDTSNLSGEMMLTARVKKDDSTFETIVMNLFNETEDLLESRPNGATLVRPLDLVTDQLDVVYDGIEHINNSENGIDPSKIALIKEMLVRNMTNVDGKPDVIRTKISMLNNTDVRYISYGENPAEVTGDVLLHNGMMAMREANENAAILKREVKDGANIPVSNPLNGIIGMYNVDANLITMLSLGAAELPQLAYVPHNATADDIAAATAASADATAAAAAALPGAIVDATESMVTLAAEAATMVADATANVALATANPCGTDETRACAAHKLEEANEVYAKASELGGLGVAQYMTACGVGFGTAFHAGGAMVPTTTDTTTDNWVECVSTFFEDYAAVRVAISDAAELDDDIEVIATHSKDIGDYTTYDVLRTANIFDRMKMLEMKMNMTDDERQEYADLVDRANFIANPNTMLPSSYSLNKGFVAGGFDTPNNDFYRPDSYTIDDLYRKVIGSGMTVNAVVIETKLDDCADGCGQ